MSHCSSFTHTPSLCERRSFHWQRCLFTALSHSFYKAELKTWPQLNELTGGETVPSPRACLGDGTQSVKQRKRSKEDVLTVHEATLYSL